MAKTVVGLFDTFDAAQDVVQDLVDSGFRRDDISLVANDAKGEYANYGGDGDGNSQAAEGAGAGAVGGGVLGGVLGLLVGIGALAIPGIGPVLAAGPLAAALGSAAVGAGLGAVTGGLVGALVGAGIPEQDATFYAEGVRRGGALVMVNASDNMARQAYDILQRHGAVDVNERGTQWRQSGWTGFDANAEPYRAEEIDSFRTTSHTAGMTGGSNVRSRDLNQGNTVLPVIEEDLQVGKREVERGGVRVNTRVTETPVEEQVTLREERVDVERRAVNRPVSDADLHAFEETSFEVTERAEEAVVSKQARVIEEVVIDKDVRERTETIRDNVRRTDVDVERVGGERAVGASGFDAYDADFRNHYQTTYGSSGGTYDQYAPVYRYGYSLGANKRYSGGDWNTVEPEARRYWEERNPGTWEEFKDSVRYAWDRARGRR